MKWYLAGPMSGIKDFNYPAFHQAARTLREIGEEVINPADNFDGRQDLPYRTYIDKALDQVAHEADGICLLRGWELSPGAIEELGLAIAKRKLVRTYETLTGTISPMGDEDPGAQVEGRAEYLSAEEFARENSEWLTSHYEDGVPVIRAPAAFIEQNLAERAWGMVVNGDRQAAYGHPNSDFAAKGRIDAAILSRWLESEGLEVVERPAGAPRKPVHFPDIPPRIATLMMQSVKISREAAHPKQDNRDDGCGYWICTDRAVKAGTADEY